MNKKRIIIIITSAIISFSGAFIVTMMLKKYNPNKAQAQISSQEQVKEQESNADSQESAGIKLDMTSRKSELQKSLSEKQLQNLIYDVREKIKENESQKQHLDEQEKRLHIVQGSLQQEIDNLNSLKVELTSTLSSLKQQQQNLENTIIEISEMEKQNIKTIAKRYNMMDVAYASKIMINMVTNNQLNDVVKILYYMGERESAKLLGQIGQEQTAVAAQLCKSMQRLKENEGKI